MQVLSLSLRDFRSYHDARVGLGDTLTVVTGPNGAGKTNLLEGLYFACTGRSCRTNNEREVVKFGAGTARVVLTCQDEDGLHELSVGFSHTVTVKAKTKPGAAVMDLRQITLKPKR